jgi:hypothetical protein
VYRVQANWWQFDAEVDGMFVFDSCGSAYDTWYVHAQQSRIRWRVRLTFGLIQISESFIAMTPGEQLQHLTPSVAGDCVVGPIARRLAKVMKQNTFHW